MAGRSAVYVGHRHQFGGGAGEKALVCGVKIVGRQRLFARLDAECGRQFQHHGAGNAGQRAVARRRRQQPSALHDEEVVGAAFGHAAGGVEHHRLIRAGAVCLQPRQNRVQVVEALDARIEPVGAEPARRRDDQPSTAPPRVGHRVEPVGDDEERGLPATARVDPQRAHAARHHQAQITGIVGYGGQGLCHRPGQRLLVPRQAQRQCARRLREALQMCLKPEGAAMVKADALEDAVAIEQPVVEHRHGRLGGRQQAAVHPADGGLAGVRWAFRVPFERFRHHHRHEISSWETGASAERRQIKSPRMNTHTAPSTAGNSTVVREWCSSARMAVRLRSAKIA